MWFKGAYSKNFVIKFQAHLKQITYVSMLMGDTIS